VAVIEKLGVSATITISATLSLIAGPGTVSQISLSAGTPAVYLDNTYPWGAVTGTSLTASVTSEPDTGLPNRVRVALSGGGASAVGFDADGGEQTGSWSVSFVADLVRSEGSIFWMPQWGAAWSVSASLGPASISPSGTFATPTFASWLPFLAMTGQCSVTAGSGDAALSVGLSCGDGTNTWSLDLPYSTSRTWASGVEGTVDGGGSVEISGGSTSGFAVLTARLFPQRTCTICGRIWHGNGPAGNPVDLIIDRRDRRNGSGVSVNQTILDPGDEYTHVESQSGLLYSGGVFANSTTLVSESGQLTQVSQNTYRSWGPLWRDRTPGSPTLGGNMVLQSWNAWSCAIASTTWTRRTTAHWQFRAPAGLDLRAWGLVRVRVRHTTLAAQTVWIVVGDSDSTALGGSISPIRVWKKDRAGAAMVTGSAGSWSEFTLDWLRPDDTYIDLGSGPELISHNVEVDVSAPGGTLIYSGEQVFDASIDSGGKWLKVLPASISMSDANLEFDQVTGVVESAKLWATGDPSFMCLVDGRAGSPTYSLFSGPLGGWTVTNLATSAWTALFSGAHTLFPRFPTGGRTDAGGAVSWGGNGMVYIGGGEWRLDWGISALSFTVPQQRSIARLDDWPAGIGDVFGHGYTGVSGFHLPCSYRERGIMVGVAFDTVGRRTGAGLEIAEPGSPQVSFGEGLSGSAGVFSTGAPFGRKVPSHTGMRFQPAGGGSPFRDYTHSRNFHWGAMVQPRPPDPASVPLEIWSAIHPTDGHFSRAWVDLLDGSRVLYRRTGGGIPGDTALGAQVAPMPASPDVRWASPTFARDYLGRLILWASRYDGSAWAIYEAVSDDEGDSWSEPVKVYPEGAGTMPDNPHPRIATATGDGIGGLIFYWFEQGADVSGITAGKLKGQFVAPGATFDPAEAVYFQDDAEDDLVVGYGTTHLVQSSSGQCWWVLSCLIPGDTDISEWRCTDEETLTFERIT
jgi:hypothetical protein